MRRVIRGFNMEDIFKKIDAHIEEEEALFDSGRDDAYHRIQGILWVKTLLMDSTNSQPEDATDPKHCAICGREFNYCPFCEAHRHD